MKKIIAVIATLFSAGTLFLQFQANVGANYTEPLYFISGFLYGIVSKLYCNRNLSKKQQDELANQVIQVSEILNDINIQDVVHEFEVSPDNKSEHKLQNPDDPSPQV